MDETRGIP